MSTGRKGTTVFATAANCRTASLLFLAVSWLVFLIAFPGFVESARAADAMEELFRRHWPRAHRAAWLVVHDAAAAEDVAQEAFIAAVRALDRFDRRRPFGPWLHRIVVNRAIDWARARALRPEAEAVDVPVTEPPERDDELLRELDRLSPEHRAVIVLRYLLDYTPGEIAELLELPRGTVNSRLRRGLDNLKDRLR